MTSPPNSTALAGHSAASTFVPRKRVVLRLTLPPHTRETVRVGGARRSSASSHGHSMSPPKTHNLASSPPKGQPAPPSTTSPNTSTIASKTGEEALKGEGGTPKEDGDGYPRPK
ncbi:hypothetical protein T439DRAFT_328618 [Meredithblackwellia eburnea MCA 4105]